MMTALCPYRSPAVGFCTVHPSLSIPSQSSHHSHNLSQSLPSTKPIPLPTPKRLRRLKLPLRDLLPNMPHRRRIRAGLQARARAVRNAVLRRRRSDVARTNGPRRLPPALHGERALLAVGVDAALREVVGAAAGEDQHAPAVGYGGFLVFAELGRWGWRGEGGRESVRCSLLWLWLGGWVGGFWREGEMDWTGITNCGLMSVTVGTCGFELC